MPPVHRIRYIEVTKRFRFSAAHFLPEHDGACCQMHGHNFEVDVTVRGIPNPDPGPTHGMVVEFSTLKVAIDSLGLDHRLLNDVLPDAYLPGTTENVARFIGDELHRLDFNVMKVRLWETPDNSATVRW